MTPLVKSVELPTKVRLSYVEQGAPAGVPVLLLHGLGDSWRSFEPVLEHLPESIHAFALTQRGHGDSSHPAEGYRFVDFVEDLAAFLDALHLPVAVLAGHSSHGVVSERFAIDHPARVSGLVLIGTPVSLQDNPAAKGLFDSTISKLTDPLDPQFVSDFAKSTLAQPVPQAFLEIVRQETMKVPALVFREFFAGLLQEDVSTELKKLDVPALLVWGDRDAILTRSDQDALATAIPHSRLLVYPGAGHSPHWEEPERFAFDLAAFMEGFDVDDGSSAAADKSPRAKGKPHHGLET